MFYKFYLATACLAVLAAGAVSCVNTDDLESRLDGIEDKVEALEEVVRQINDNAIAAYTLITEGQIVMDVHAYDDGTLYRIDMSDGSSIVSNGGKSTFCSSFPSRPGGNLQLFFSCYKIIREKREKVNVFPGQRHSL